jgi:esterase/lipase
MTEPLASPARARRWTRALLLIGAILLLVAALGPRTRVEVPKVATERPPFPAQLGELPAWLAAREQAAGATDTFTAARIRFAGDTARTAWVVVHLHGFSGSRQESAPFVETIATGLGANLYEARLAGHGLAPEALQSTDANAWMRDALLALAIGEQLGDSIVLVGLSTGGTLISWLAMHPALTAAPIGAVVLISPNFGAQGPIPPLLRLPWVNRILPRVMPRLVLDDRPPPNDEVARMGYAWVPVPSLFHMQALVDHVVAQPLTTYRARTLLLQHRGDPVVDVARVIAWTAQLRAHGVPVEETWVTVAEGEHPHVLAGRHTGPSQTSPLSARVLAFLQPRTSSAPVPDRE